MLSNHPLTAWAAARVRPYLPPLNFITIHYCYFLGVSLAASLVFWGSSEPAWSVSYADSLFMVVSAITETGLNTVSLSVLTTWQQVILYLLIVFGGAIWVSIWTVAFRKHVFGQRFNAVVRARQPEAVSTGSGLFSSALPRHLIGRNAQFHNLTAKERDRLGGYEYRALQLLSVVIPLYFVLWHLLGSLALGAWISGHMPSTATSNGINPWWLGIFNAASAFNNSGMSLIDANMVPFQGAHLVLITMGLMILAGNTAYPVFLRFIFWTGRELLYRTTRRDQCMDLKATLTFVLRYPRRVYTNMFPPQPTWWLLFTVVLINCIDWVAFELLNLTNPVVKAIPTGSRILDGLFQALAIRSGGFSVVAMSDLYIGLLVLYVIMMYISVYPVAITMRSSNVYEERSLGIYMHHHARSTADMELELADTATDSSTNETTSPPRAAVDVFYRDSGRTGFVRQQIHSQLADDLWLLALAIFLITTIETSSFLREPVTHGVFNTIFEVVSGYGCVGVSMGVPGASYSLSGSWHAASKVVLCIVMIKGRHRGLPVALDRAVRLPGAQLYQDEEEDYRIQQGITDGDR